MEPLRFGLKYDPVPTLALEYKKSSNAPQLLVIPMPQIGSSNLSELMRKMQSQHAELHRDVVNSNQLFRLLERLQKQVKDSDDDVEHFSGSESSDSF